MFTQTIYTVGYGCRSINDFLQLLQSKNIQTLVDIRSHPYSRRFPQYSQDQLRATIEEKGMVYHLASRHFGAKRKIYRSSQHTALKKDSLRAFADYMESDDFKKAAIQLINLSSKAATVIMCAETLPEH